MKVSCSNSVTYPPVMVTPAFQDFQGIRRPTRRRRTAANAHPNLNYVLARTPIRILRPLAHGYDMRRRRASTYLGGDGPLRKNSSRDFTSLKSFGAESIVFKISNCS